MDYFLTTHQHGSTSAQCHQTFHQKVLLGEVRAAVRYLMATEKGGVLFPEDVDPVTGQTVAEVLASKHPPPQIPSPTSLPSYPSTPKKKQTRFFSVISLSLKYKEDPHWFIMGSRREWCEFEWDLLDWSTKFLKRCAHFCSHGSYFIFKFCD